MPLLRTLLVIQILYVWLRELPQTSMLAMASAADQSTGTRWEKIMNLWMSPELGQPLHYDVLPDGLPDTDELGIIVLGFQLNPDGTM